MPIHNRKRILTLLLAAIMPAGAVIASAAPATAPSANGVACLSPEAGWITCPHSTGRIVYVAAGGDDTAPGSEAQPVRTIHHAYAMLANPGDLIALHRGDVFTEAGIEWKKTGTSTAYSGIVTYGSSPSAPVWNCDTTGILILSFDAKGYLFFDGFDLVCPRRDPSGAHFTIADATTGPANPADAFQASVKAPVGIQIVAAVVDVVIQDVTLQWFDDDISIQCPNLETTAACSQNIVLCRSRIEDSWSLNQFGGQGIFASNIQGLSIVDCSFAENSHRDPGTDSPAMTRPSAFIVPTIYRHAVYLSGYPSSGPATVSNCVFYSPSSYGIQARAGASVTGCYFSDCGLACLLSGRTGSFTGNVVKGGHMHSAGPIVGTGKGGVAFTCGSGSVTGNIFSDVLPYNADDAAKTCPYPVAAIDLGRRQWSPGVVSATVSNNIISGWWGIGIEIDGNFDAAAVTGNTILRTGRAPIADAVGKPVTGRPGITLSNNASTDIFICNYLPDETELIARARAQRRPTWSSDNTASAAIAAGRMNFTPN